jgi:hypothetical protein
MPLEAGGCCAALRGLEHDRQAAATALSLPVLPVLALPVLPALPLPVLLQPLLLLGAERAPLHHQQH